jgi:hypothetical protein
MSLSLATLEVTFQFYYSCLLFSFPEEYILMLDHHRKKERKNQLKILGGRGEDTHCQRKRKEKN